MRKEIAPLRKRGHDRQPMHSKFTHPIPLLVVAHKKWMMCQLTCIVTMSLWIWLVIVLADGAGMIYHILVITALLDFETDRTSPLDLCQDLEKTVVPMLTTDAACVLLSLGDVKRAWPIMLCHLGIILSMILARKRKQVFVPTLIVRDLKKMKIRYLIFAIIGILTVVWSFVQMALTLLD